MTAIAPVPDLTARNRRMLHMVAAGLTNRQIGDEVGLKQRQVITIRNSPLFIAALEELNSKIEARVVDDLADVRAKLRGEADKCVDVLMEVRDGQHGGRPTDKAAAANSLLDRIPELQRKQQTIERQPVIILSDRAAKQMEAIVDELKILPTPCTAPKDPDEFAAACEAEVVDYDIVE